LRGSFFCRPPGFWPPFFSFLVVKLPAPCQLSFVGRASFFFFFTAPFFLEIGSSHVLRPLCVLFFLIRNRRNLHPVSILLPPPFIGISLQRSPLLIRVLFRGCVLFESGWVGVGKCSRVFPFFYLSGFRVLSTEDVVRLAFFSVSSFSFGRHQWANCFFFRWTQTPSIFNDEIPLPTTTAFPVNILNATSQYFPLSSPLDLTLEASSTFPFPRAGAPPRSFYPATIALFFDAQSLLLPWHCSRHFPLLLGFPFHSFSSFPF